MTTTLDAPVDIPTPNVEAVAPTPAPAPEGDARPVSALTVGELRAMLRELVQEALQSPAAPPAPVFVAPPPLTPEQAAALANHPQRGIFELPPISVGPWPEGLELLSREELYGDEGR